MQKKIITYPNLSPVQKAIKSQKSVLVGGCFDIIHFGHVTFLQGAREEGDVLLVALESDEFIEANKKRTPVHTQEQRALVLSAFTFIDYVVLLPYFEDSSEYYNLVQSINPSVIAITENDQKVHLKRGHAAQVGADIKVVCPELTSFSTTKIVEYANIFSD